MPQMAYLISLILSTLFVFYPAPLTSALIIISQAALVSYLAYAALATSWLSFILFLVFISAMMVVYAYVASLAANDFFFAGAHLPLIVPFLMLTLAMAFIKNSLQPLDFAHLSTMDLTDLVCAPLLVHKLYASGAVAVTVFLIIYLLVALVAVAKNASYCSGPLRSKTIYSNT